MSWCHYIVLFAVVVVAVVLVVVVVVVVGRLKPQQLSPRDKHIPGM